MPETHTPTTWIDASHIEFLKRLDENPTLHNLTAEPTLYDAGMLTYHNTRAVITHEGRRAIQEYDRIQGSS